MKKQLFKLNFVIFTLALTCSITDASPPQAKLTQNTGHDRSTGITIYKDSALISEKLSLDVNGTNQTHEIDDVSLTLIANTVMIYLSGHQSDGFVQEHYLKRDLQKKTAKLVLITKNPQPSPTKTLWLHYMCTGLTWKPFYTLKLSPKYEEVTVNGWIIVDNTTNVDFHSAKLLFIDGNAPDMNKQNSNSTQNNLKSYGFSSHVSIAKNETKKLNWISYERLPARPELRINIGKKYLKDMDSKIVNPEVETWLSFSNNNQKTRNSGLPEGDAVLYFKDEQGFVELLGKSEMNVLEKGREISVRIPHNRSDKDTRSERSSNDFLKKIHTELDQIEFKKLSDDLTESSYRLTVKNKSDRPLTIKVSVNLPKCKEWIVVRENVAHQELGDESLYWTINVEPKKESDLLFRIRIVWLEPIADSAEFRKP